MLPIIHRNPACKGEASPYLPVKGKNTMKQSEIFRENAENCAHLAEAAANEPTFLRYKRMEAAWLALANEQDWLDGELSPAPLSIARNGNGSVTGKAASSDPST
jgi:hypothetical protein